MFVVLQCVSRTSSELVINVFSHHPVTWTTHSSQQRGHQLTFLGFCGVEALGIGNVRIVCHQSFRINNPIMRKSPGKATCVMASPREVTGAIPAVKLDSIHPSKEKYTANFGFLQKAALTMVFAVLYKAHPSEYRTVSGSMRPYKHSLHRQNITYLLIRVCNSTRFTQFLGDFGSRFEFFLIARCIGIHWKG